MAVVRWQITRKCKRGYAPGDSHEHDGPCHTHYKQMGSIRRRVHAKGNEKALAHYTSAAVLQRLMADVNDLRRKRKPTGAERRLWWGAGGEVPSGPNHRVAVGRRRAAADGRRGPRVAIDVDSEESDGGGAPQRRAPKRRRVAPAPKPRPTKADVALKRQRRTALRDAGTGLAALRGTSAGPGERTCLCRLCAALLPAEKTVAAAGGVHQQPPRRRRAPVGWVRHRVVAVVAPHITAGRNRVPRWGEGARYFFLCPARQGYE